MTALALTPQPATASVLLQLTGMPGSLTNELPNPGFEVDTTGWEAQGTGSVLTRSTTQKDTGAASGRVVIGSDPGAFLRTNIIPPVGASTVPGRTYGARLRVWISHAETLYMAIRFIDAGAGTTAYVNSANVAAPAGGGFVTLYVTGVAPALTVDRRLYVYKVSANAGRTAYVDSAVSREVAAWETFSPDFFFTGTIPQSFTITRSDANGVAPVRLRDGQAPIGGVLNVTDYEPALVGAVVYDVVDAQQVRTTVATTLAGAVTGPRIVGVQEPQLTVAPELITGYDAQRESGSTVLRVIGRGDPVILLAPTRTREGRLDVWARDYADALQAADVMAESRILLLRQPTHPGMDMYFLAQSVVVQPLQRAADGWRWQTTAQYIEVRNPNLPLLGSAGWSFDDLVAGYPSFATARSAFGTFNDLLVGP